MPSRRLVRLQLLVTCRRYRRDGALVRLYRSPVGVWVRAKLLGGASPLVPRGGWGFQIRSTVCDQIGHKIGPPASDGYSRCVRCLEPIRVEPETLDLFRPLELAGH